MTRIIYKSVAARLVVVPAHQILQHLPRRLGSSRALDTAVKCVCSNGSAAPGPIYSEALANLQEALNRSDRAVTSETLAAAMLLQMYEHSVDHAEYRWIIHARGVISMIQQRGPSCIRNELDRSIVQAQVGNIWFKSLQDGDDCFLARPEWREVVFDTFSLDKGFNAEWSAMIRAGLPIPGILHRYELLDEESSLSTYVVEGMVLPEDRESCTRLILDIWRVLNEMSELRARFQLRTASQVHNHPDEVLERPSARYASRLAINLYYILLIYMLEIMLGSAIGAASARFDLFDMISLSDYNVTWGRLQALVSATLLDLKNLRCADHIAATQTIRFSRMIIRKVLDSPLSRQSKVQGLSPIIENLFENLAEDCFEDAFQMEGHKF